MELARQFSSREVDKRYSALVCGIPGNPEGTINRGILRHPKDINKMVLSEAGKEAITDYKVVKTFVRNKQKFSLLDVKIHTGRYEVSKD